MATSSKMGGSKRKKCNDRHFVIIRRNLITLPMDVSKSCKLLECFLHALKYSKKYNSAKTKTCYLPEYGPLTCLKRYRVGDIEFISHVTVNHVTKFR